MLILSSCIGGTLMMDGWIDRYKRLPYFGVKIATVHKWKFKVLTVNISPVESHKVDMLSKHVKSVLADFMPGRKTLFFNTTENAANVKLQSSLLGHERINCSAHGLHLFLTVDSMHLNCAT